MIKNAFLVIIVGIFMNSSIAFAGRSYLLSKEELLERYTTGIKNINLKYFAYSSFPIKCYDCANSYNLKTIFIPYISQNELIDIVAKEIKTNKINPLVQSYINFMLNGKINKYTYSEPFIFVDAFNVVRAMRGENLSGSKIYKVIKKNNTPPLLYLEKILETLVSTGDVGVAGFLDNTIAKKMIKENVLNLNIFLFNKNLISKFIKSGIYMPNIIQNVTIDLNVSRFSSNEVGWMEKTLRDNNFIKKIRFYQCMIGCNFKFELVGAE